MTVRLCMLARDEADQIARVAAAVGDLVDDYVVLLDHRTTDDTDEAIVRELGERGRVVPFRFRDFADARNQLFHHSRPGADWLLLVDPDSPPTGALPPLDGDVDVYRCTWRLGSFDYHLPILVRADLDCAYEGACHELLVAPPTARTEHTDALTVVVPPKPPNVERLETYVELLRRDAATSPRSAFYLARGLRDLGRNGEAIEAYLKAAQMGARAWEEETFVALLDAGELMLALDVELAETLLRRASLRRPGRAEPLYWLAWLENWRGDSERAEEYALAGLAVAPSTDALFVNRWIEGAGLVSELAKARICLRAALGADETSTMEPANGISLH